MTRLALLAGVALFAAGCLSTVDGVTCEADNDCPESAVCETVKGEQLCITCDRCPQGQVCRRNQCVFAEGFELRIVSPADGTELGQPAFEAKVQLVADPAAATFTAPAALTVDLTDPAGKTTSHELPAIGDSLYAATLRAQAKGEHTLVAHSGEARSGAVTVNVTACALECTDPTKECIDNACVPSFTGLTIVSPAADAHAAQLVNVTAQLERTPGGVAPPPGLTIAFDTEAATAMTRVADSEPPRFSARPASPLTPGLHTALVAAPPAYELTAARVGFTVEAPPVIESSYDAPIRPPSETGLIVLDPTPADPEVPATMRRNEKLRVKLVSDKPLSLAKLKVQAAGSDRVAIQPLALTSATGATPYVYEGTLNLWHPDIVLEGLRTTLTVTTVAVDEVGNQVSVPGKLNLTRFKWRRAAPNTVSAVLDLQGNVYVTRDDPAGLPLTIAQLGPEGFGRKAWSLPAGSGRVSRLGVGTLSGKGYVLAAGVGQLGGGGFLAAVPDITTSYAPFFYRCLSNNAEIQFGPNLAFALPTDNESTVYALASSHGSEGGSGSAGVASLLKLTSDTCTALPLGFDTAGRSELLRNGSSLAAVDSAGQVQWLPATDGTTSFKSLTAVNSVGDLIFGSGGVLFGSDASELFRLDPATNQARKATTWDAVPGHAIIASGRFVAATTYTKVHSIPEAFEPEVNPHTELGVSADEGFQAAPVMGADGTLYVVSGAGTLFVRDIDTQPLWDTKLDVLGTTGAVQSVTLDCGRVAGASENRPLAGEPGVLYVTTTNAVTAIIVDSPGLAAGAWPSFRHDPSQTSNAKADVSVFSCPALPPTNQ